MKESRNRLSLCASCSIGAVAAALSGTAAAQTGQSLSVVTPQAQPIQSSQPQRSATAPDQSKAGAARVTSSAGSQPRATGSGAIVVTGFRASLHSALNQKRRSNEEVDVINADDIAEFPDANLAESIQRLPGVSIDRDNGEGRSITVRGLSGDFNRTQIDGMEALSTAGANDSGSSANRSRSFDYNTFASELFNSIKIQKTQSAKTDEGSLGATIGLQTGRPFDFKKSAFALSAQGNYQENSAKWTPRLAGLASTRFMDGKMGILVSAAYSTERNRIDQYARQPGSADYLYRGSTWAGSFNPPRAGFAAPVGTNFGSAVTNPDVLNLLTGSDPTAYANLYPGAPYSTPGSYADSLVRIPALATLQQQDVKYRRLGLTASYQWQISDRTRLSIDGLYSKFHNFSQNNQIQSVGLNRNNTNATYNTAGNNLTPFNARSLYPGLCTPNDDTTNLKPLQDCGQSLYGNTPAFDTALDKNGKLVPAVLYSRTTNPTAANNSGTANIFSVNPYDLDPYDYYNNPNSVGYIPSSNRLAFRGSLIGRPAVDVLQSDVQNGVADYLVLRNVDFRSAVDQAAYTTTFWQGSATLDQQFTDNLKMSLLYGQSRSHNVQQGELVEFNNMDSQGLFVYDERNHGNMPVINFGFDAADPSNWQTVKGFSAIRDYLQIVTNTYRTARADFDWNVDDRFDISWGADRRQFKFETEYWQRNTDTLNPTLLEAGTDAANMGRVVSFGKGLDLPKDTATSFYVPDIAKFDQLFNFTCNCVNKWGDWRLTNLRNGGRDNFDVTETDTAGYLQADWNFDLFGHPFRGDVGVRIAHTDLQSHGTTTAGRPTTGTNSYTDWLPALNAVYEPVHNLLFRFAYSKSMARPLLGNLSPTITSVSIPSNGDTTGGSLTIGNPKLKPFYSTNLDASIEWYFSSGSLLSIAGFNKHISSFPQTVLFDAPLSTFLDAASLAALTQQFTNANQLAYIANDYPVTARQFRDAPGGYIRGVEISYQQDFKFLPGFLKNFGVIANYTYIKSKLKYILDPTSMTIGVAPWLNVSPQAYNATLYYEDSRFHARVSVAHRKGYSTTYPIASGSCNPGACDTPLVNDFVFSGPTTNVDVSASYRVTRFFSITFEGLNITNQPSQRYAYEQNPVVTQYASSGPIYRIGARLSF